MQSTEKDILIEKIKKLSLEQVRKVLMFIDDVETRDNTIKKKGK